MKTVLIYNKFFNTYGGGERSSLSVALFFESIGYRVILASLTPFNHYQLLNFFGLKQKNYWHELVFNAESAIEAFVEEFNIDVFVNHTFSSDIHNKAPLGIYLVMFPQQPEDLSFLNTYTHFISISPFVDKYVEEIWKLKEKRHILIPPLFPAIEIDLNKKEKIILNVGRFTSEGSVKNQHLAIREFKKLNLPDWKLVIIGRLGDKLEDSQYFHNCKEEAGDASNIEILINISHQELLSLYERASLLWQLTGVQLEGEEHPELCEHLGLVAMDCFSYGVVPIVFYRSGIADLIRPGQNGFTFKTLEELNKVTLDYIEKWETDYNTKRQIKSFKTSKLYGFDKYSANFKKIIDL